MKRGLLILAIIFILSIISASAANFVVSHEEVIEKISLFEDAKVDITMQNIGKISDTYRFSVKNPNWNLFAKDLTVKNTGLKLVSNEEKTVTFILKPTTNAPGGRNTITLLIESEITKEVVEYEFPIIVQKEGYEGYVPTILASIEIPEKIDPREVLTLKIKLENKNVRDNKNINIRMWSNTFSKELNTSIGPLLNKTEEISISLDPLTPPTVDTLRSSIDIDGTKFTPTSIEFEIIDYTPEFEMKVEETKSYFKTIKTITYTNKGNKESKQTAKYAINGLASIFTTSSPKRSSIIRQDGERYLGWDLTLKPNESSSIEVTTNFRWLLIIIAVIIIILIYIKIVKSPVVMEKSAQNIKRKEGGIAEMKITLNLKNKSPKTMENVEIRDIVPNIADVSKEFEIGTLTPTRTFKNKSGNTVIKWDISDLDPHEERIISYKIKSKLSILGDFNLPVSIVKYRNKRGKEIIVKSNKLSISSQGSSQEQ